MADSKLIERSGERILTSTGVPAAGAKIYVYDAGTSDLSTIYSDADRTQTISNPQTCDSAGLAPFVYVGTGAYKLRVETSVGTLIDEEDNIPGAINTGNLSATYARPKTPVIVKTSNYTITTDDLGKVINGNSTGGDFTLTLPSAATAEDGATITMRHTGSANQVKIVTSSSQTITGPFSDGAVGSLSLTGYGESVTITSDAAGWHVISYVPPLMRGNMGVIPVIDRITAAPGTPVDGGRYLVTASYSTFETHDIIEYSGQTGTYIEYTPASDCGWIAYVQDENAYYSFVDSAWVEMAATQADMETATNVSRFSTPGRQKNHPAHPKGWVYISMSGGTPSNAGSHGVSSLTDSGLGQIGVSLSTSMSSTGYIATGTFLGSPSGFRAASVFVSNIGTSGFTSASLEATATADTALTSQDISTGVLWMGDQ